MKLKIQKSIEIQKSVQDVFQIISDFSKWNNWSPWIQCEPTAKTELKGQPGQIQQTIDWVGEVIGAGRMTLVNLQKDRRVESKLEFFVPFKNEGSANFELSETGPGRCQVTWTSEMGWPVFLFFLKGMMSAYIGSDFERGLKMLKEFCETGHVVSKAVYQDEKSFSGFQVMGKRTRCQIADLSKCIRADFESLFARAQKGEIDQPEGIITLSHVHDIPKGISEYTAGYMYKTGVGVKVPTDLELIQVPEHKALLVDFYGPYRNIGNGWSMIVAYQRGKKKKLNKKAPMYEHYKTMPDGRPEKDIYTQIVLPVK
jgi:predicted transcriptional regulator YdeE